VRKGAYIYAMHKEALRCANDTCMKVEKKRKDMIIILAFIAVYLTWSFLYVSPSSLSNLHHKKHSLPQDTFFKSATGAIISFFYDAKGQSG